MKPWHALVAGVAVALAICDAVTTHLGLEFGAEEGNPTALLVLERWGAPLMLACGILATLFVAILTIAAGHLGHTSGRIIVAVGCTGLAVKAWAVANNVVVLGALAP